MIKRTYHLSIHPPSSPNGVMQGAYHRLPWGKMQGTPWTSHQFSASMQILPPNACLWIMGADA